MRLLKDNNFLDYGINLSKKSILFKIFGLKNKKYSFLNSNLKNIEQDLDTFLKINLEKKEYIIKTKVMNKVKKLENGSYKGYKNYRGLPINNQRTKTNSRTSRRIIN